MILNVGVVNQALNNDKNVLVWGFNTESYKEKNCMGARNFLGDFFRKVRYTFHLLRTHNQNDEGIGKFDRLLPFIG